MPHAMEKIKTIGDAFFAAAGLLKPMQNGVLASVRCARAMIETSRRLKPGWTIHVGIHNGPVIAGIMGRRQYLFDLWGDWTSGGHPKLGSVLVNLSWRIC